jgi:hypothetical protein
MPKKRTLNLRSKFGLEYDKAISEHRDRGHAESELQKRAARVAKFNIHPLKAEVASAIKQLREVFAAERHKLDDNVSTEKLRVALRRYRSFFDRLLSV